MNHGVMKKIVTGIIFFIYSFGLSAQPFFDVTSVYYQHSPDAALFGKDKNPFATDYFLANVNLPVNINKKDRFLINPVFEWSRLNFIQREYLNVDLYGITLALTYMKQWKNEKWKTAFISVNRISSDLYKINMKHYQPGAAVLMIYERSKKIKYKLGVYYNAEFFGAYVIPLVGIDWKINNRFTLHGLVPRNLVLEYRIAPSFYTGINWKAITASYRFQSENTSDYFKIEENQIKLFADFYLTKHLVLNLEAGHTFFRKYNKRSEIQRQAGIDSDLQVNEGLLFKAGIYYRIRLDESNK